MEIITSLVQNQLVLILPVGLVILGFILLFTYAIRPARQPTFLSSLNDGRTAGRKKKLKEKKSTANGHVATGVSKTEKSPAKEQKKSPESTKKEKKVDVAIKEAKKSETVKKVPEPQETKKKSNKKAALEKPADFDDGNWETVPTKADKKKKVEPVPAKKEKKNKAQLDVKAPVKEESPEKEVVQVVEEQIEPEVEPEPETPAVVETPKAIEEPAPVVEEKKEKKKKNKKVNKPIPAEEPAEAAITPTPVAVKQSPPPVQEPNNAPAPTPSGAAFDELGDTWTEAKPVKKSKKKARRDN